MSYSTNLELLLTPEDDTTTSFREWRTGINGEDADSAMAKIDRAYGELRESVLTNKADIETANIVLSTKQNMMSGYGPMDMLRVGLYEYIISVMYPDSRLDGKVGTLSIYSKEGVDNAVKPGVITIGGTGTNPGLYCEYINTIYNIVDPISTYNPLDITLPPSANNGEYIQLDFTCSDSNANIVMNSTSGLIGDEIIPQPNMVYSVFFDWGRVGYQAYGWRMKVAEYPFTEE